jgi:preprotein translocase subunit SecG
MYTLILIVHIIVCFFLIFIVLVQSGKGAELGAAFGGSSQTLFGARGAATFFSKLTTIAAVVFMLTSLALAIVTAKGGSVIRRVPAASEQKKNLPPMPSAPAGPIQGAQPPGNLPAPAAPSK